MKKVLTPKEIAQRSRTARRGGMARKKNLGKESGIRIEKASDVRRADIGRFN